MARTDTLGNFLTDVADAIRTKKGTNETIPAKDFDTEIENLPSGGGDLDEYFVMEITENTEMSNEKHFNVSKKLVKKYPDIIVANNVTSLYYGFSQYDDTKVPKLIFGNNITNIGSLFNNVSNVTEIDVSGFNTSNVTNMGSLFSGCSKLVNADLSNFNTEKVTSFSYMFSGCQKLTSVNLSSFDTKNSTTFQSMFENCKELISLDLSSFENTKANKQTIRMFGDCLKLSFIDMRRFTFNFINTSISSDMFGASASNGVPDNCEIIVADDTAKAWINTNFSRLTNVKTVAEYEAEQSA